MGLDFKFLVRSNHLEDERPDTEFWWEEREVENALEEAGRRIREMRNVLALEPTEAFPITETLQDEVLINNNDISIFGNSEQYINHIKHQQASRMVQALIDNEFIEFTMIHDMNNNTRMRARLKVQKINR